MTGAIIFVYRRFRKHGGGLNSTSIYHRNRRPDLRQSGDNIPLSALPDRVLVNMDADNTTSGASLEEEKDDFFEELSLVNDNCTHNYDRLIEDEDDN